MVVSRRLLLWSAAALALTSRLRANDRQARHFRTAEADIEMTIEFHDGYSSRGFELGDLLTDRRFCLSADGEVDRNCLSEFRGSLAIAHYRVRPRSRGRGKLALREYVRTIDRDKRLGDRPPFERAIELEKGAGSDLQVFGYEPQPGEEPIPEKHGPWYLYRQDLFLDTQPSPFLIVYWKHALTAIRVLDVIPGDHTLVVNK
jgi:hypothetical protein